MSPEEKALLERTYNLVEENNKILSTLNRRHKFGFAIRATYWMVVIGPSIGAFYFIKPYLQFLTDLTGDSGSSLNQNIKDLLK